MIRRSTSFQISTLAPREGSDDGGTADRKRTHDFNPRSPRGERRRGGEPRHRAVNFNPRSPRGERRTSRTPYLREPMISTLAPREGSDCQLCPVSHGYRISTLAPREGSDLVCQGGPFVVCQFQPSLPARGATQRPEGLPSQAGISTLAPREGSDGRRFPAMLRASDFNPRSPRGERRRMRRSRPSL